MSDQERAVICAALTFYHLDNVDTAAQATYDFMAASPERFRPSDVARAKEHSAEAEQARWDALNDLLATCAALDAAQSAGKEDSS